MNEFRPIRARRSRVVHVTEVDDMRRTACRKSCESGWTIAVDESPTCKVCLRAMLDALN